MADEHIPIWPEKFVVSGAAYRQEDILSVLVKNPDYMESNQDLIDGGSGPKIYQYVLPEHYTLKIDPDPEDSKYPGALGVYINDTKIGYIFKNDRDRIAPLMENPGQFIAEAVGGKYKSVETKEIEKANGDTDYKDYVERGDDGDIEIHLTAYTQEQWAELKRRHEETVKRLTEPHAEAKPVADAGKKPKHSPAFFYGWGIFFNVFGIFTILLPQVAFPSWIIGITLTVIGFKRAKKMKQEE